MLAVARELMRDARYDVIRESNKMLLSCFEVTGENNRASL